MRNVMKLAGAAFIGVLGIWLGPGSLRFWQTAPPTSNLPEHIVRPTVKTIEPQVHICEAYAALFQQHPEHIAKPPLLYSLINVNNPDDFDRRELLLSRLTDKLMPHFEARDTHVRDSGAWKRAEDKVTLWYKIGAVLMDSRLQAVYDREVVATVRAGSSVTDALMKKNMCGELWRRDGREDEMKIKDER